MTCHGAPATHKKALVAAVAEKYGQIVVGPKRVLDGPGPARYGYARVTPCKEIYLGRTVYEAACSGGVARLSGAGAYG